MYPLKGPSPPANWQHRQLADGLLALQHEFQGQSEATALLAARLSDLCAEAQALAASAPRLAPAPRLGAMPSTDSADAGAGAGADAHGGRGNGMKTWSGARPPTPPAVVIQTLADQNQQLDGKLQDIEQEASGDEEEEAEEQDAHKTRNPFSRGLFVDTEELKAKIRENLQEKPYSVTIYYKDHGIFQAIARNSKFELASLALVIASSMWLAVDVDNNKEPMLNKAPIGFQVVAHLTTTLFVLELAIRFLAFKNIRNIVKDFWCVFDLILVVTIVVETWVMLFVTSMIDSKVVTSANMRMISVVRMLRLIRVLRLAKLFKHVPELLVIVRGIGIALRAITICFFLLGLIIYVNAIIFRVMLDGTDFGNTQFPDVLASMGTLLLDCALSGNKGERLIRQAYAHQPVFAFLLFFFMLISNVTVMGVLSGLLVQTVKTVAEVEEHEKRYMRFHGMMDEFWQHLLRIDDNHNGYVTQHDFHKLLEHRRAAKILKNMDVDVETLVNVSDFIFRQHQGRLSRVDFKNVVLDFRGSQHATLKDHHVTRKFMHESLANQLQPLTGGWQAFPTASSSWRELVHNSMSQRLLLDAMQQEARTTRSSSKDSSASPKNRRRSSSEGCTNSDYNRSVSCGQDETPKRAVSFVDDHIHSLGVAHGAPSNRNGLLAR